MTTSPSESPVALITGSGRPRVGFEIAKFLAKRGYAIGLHYHSSRDSAEQGRQQLVDLGVRCEVFSADVADEQEVARMFDEAMDQFGRLDVLVTTSSVWSVQPLVDVTAASMRQNFDVNTLGTFLCVKEAGLRMVDQASGGSIVTIGDWAIERPYLDHADYFISKGSIPTLTRVMAVELGSRNPRVRVNCIHPGPVMFPPDAGEEEKQELIDSTLVKHADCPESVAQTVLFLTENSFVTGVCLPVDGGRSMYSSDAAVRKRSV